MKRFFNKLLIFLGLKRKFVTGQKCRVFVAGREVNFEKGETVQLNFEYGPSIQILGRFEVYEDHLERVTATVKDKEGKKIT